jgi:hypothetical protein
MADNSNESIINLEMEGPSISSRGETARVIIKKYFNWAVFNHFVQSFMAIILSLAVGGVALYLICDSYIQKIDHPVWADIVMSLLLGVWVSGKPKFFSRKKVTKETSK